MDIKTMIVLIAIGNFLMTLLLCQYLRKAPNKTAKFHLVSQIFFTCAFMIFALMGILPKFCLIPIGNACLLFGSAFEVISISVFIGLISHKFRSIILGIAIANSFVTVYLSAVVNMSNLRIAIATFTIGFYWAVSSYLLLSQKKKSHLQIGVGLLFGLVVIFSMMRFSEAINFSGHFDLYTPGIGQILTFLGFYLYMILSGSGIILLLKEKDDEKLFAAAAFDGLTGIHNRKQFIDEAEKSMVFSSVNKRPYSLILLDIDYFKNINDTFGHLIGDEVLVHLTDLFKRETRNRDILCRFGGDEFMILLLDTNAEDAFEISERLRISVQKSPLREIDLSISIGLVSISEGCQNVNDFYDLYHLSDQALYEAKNQGRNNVAQIVL